jgi:hypothetical protein
MDAYDLISAIIIILVFFGLYFGAVLGIGLKHIENNWPKYRCNPSVMPFAGLFNHDVMQNFTFCIQNMQISSMGMFLEPIHYALSFGGEITNIIREAINAVRAFFNNIRNWITIIVKSIFGVFLNMLIEIQKLTLNIEDLFRKTLGVLATFLYILSGAVLTGKSVWDGPPGQLVRAI